MKLNQRFLGLTFLAVSLMMAPAAQAANLSIVGAGSLQQWNLSGIAASAASSRAKMGMGGGLLIEFPLGKSVGLEIGALYLGKKVDLTVLGQTFEYAFATVEAPLLLRFWLGPYVTLGAGGFIASGIGKVKAANAALGSAEMTFTGAGLKTTNYGVQGALGFILPMGKNMGFLAEGRYALGLANVNTGTAKMTTTDIEGFAGFRFGGGGK